MERNSGNGIKGLSTSSSTRTLVLLLVVVEVYATNTVANECNFPAIYNFGDSNSDTGSLAAAFGQYNSPYGHTFFHKPAGRASDGRLIIDFIAQRLGLRYLSGYLDSVGSNFSYGSNFATAGSTILPQLLTLPQTVFSPFSLNFQYIQYRNFHKRSQANSRSQGGIFKQVLPAADTFSEALYTFDIVQNDILASFLSSNTTINAATVMIPNAINQLKVTLKDVYNEGGRWFWIHSTRPLGCSPFIRQVLNFSAREIDSAGCAIPVNEACQLYNSQLQEAVKQLRHDLPSAAITYVDIYSPAYRLFSNATQYGFEKPLEGCCGYEGKYFTGAGVWCGATTEVNGTEVLLGKACQDPSVRISWDGVHYTEAANKWIFDQIVNGSYSDPPISLRKACHRRSYSH